MLLCANIHEKCLEKCYAPNGVRHLTGAILHTFSGSMARPKDKRSILSAQINAAVGIVVLMLLTCATAMLCPIECQCSVHGITVLVDCSDRELKTLPELDPAMEVNLREFFNYRVVHKYFKLQFILRR